MGKPEYFNQFLAGMGNAPPTVNVEDLPRATVRVEDLPVASPPVAAPPPPPVVSVNDLPQTPESRAATDLLPERDPDRRVHFTQVATGGSPAREVRVQGPQVDAIQKENIEQHQATAQAIADRTIGFQDRAAIAAAHEVDDANAYRQEMARRQAEHDHALAQKEQDFAAAVDDLSRRGTLDNNSLWNAKSTPEKIAQAGLTLLGGIFGGLSGQDNKAEAAFQAAQDKDLAAQKFSYAAGLDTVNGRKSAFGMMMDRYGDERAAEGAVRAAMADQTIAILKMQKAKAGSIEEANNLDKTMEAIADKRDTNKINAIRFVPATSGGVRYRASQGGQLLPGTYSEKDAQTLAKEHSVGSSQKLYEKREEGEVGLAKTIIESGGKGGKAAAQEEIHALHVQEGTEKLATRLTGMPEALVSAEMAIKATRETPRSFGERVQRAATPGMAAWTLPETAKLREGAFSNFSNQAMKLEMGSVTKNEELRAAVQFANAPSATDAERVAAIQRAMAMIDAEMKNAYGGATPEVQAQYASNRSAAQTAAPAAPSVGNAQPRTTGPGTGR